jgi:hypothetical protein
MKDCDQASNQRRIFLTCSTVRLKAQEGDCTQCTRTLDPHPNYLYVPTWSLWSVFASHNKTVNELAHFPSDFQNLFSCDRGIMSSVPSSTTSVQRSKGSKHANHIHKKTPCRPETSRKLLVTFFMRFTWLLSRGQATSAEPKTLHDLNIRIFL